jgi:cationic peptide transport system substrate-binding protein
VIFTFSRIFNRDDPWHSVNGSSFPYFDSLQFADSVKACKLDNQTVEFRLKRPDASFLWHLATHYASVMSAEYGAQLTQSRSSRNSLIASRSVPVRSSLKSTAPGSTFACSATRTTGAANR